MAKKRVKRAEDKTIDFEAALADLEQIVRDLEEGDISLGESLARYEKGVKLLRQCYDTLDGAQRKIELLTAVDAEGRPIAQPLDDSELTLAEKAERRSHRRSNSEGTPSDGGENSIGGGDVDESPDMS